MENKEEPFEYWVAKQRWDALPFWKKWFTLPPCDHVWIPEAYQKIVHGHGYCRWDEWKRRVCPRCGGVSNDQLVGEGPWQKVRSHPVV